MKKREGGRPRVYQTSIQRRIEGLLKQIQQELPPGHEGDYVVINMETDEYVVGMNPEEAMDAFDARWPEGGFFRCRVDGGAFTKFYGCQQ